MSKSRVFTSAALAGVVAIAGFSAGPAFADDPPPLAWTTVPGFPVTVDGVTVTWETATAVTSPFGGDELLDPLPVLRLDIANNAAEARHLGLGTDFVTQGDIDMLWTPEPWGAFAEVSESFRDTFWLTLQPGEALSTYGGAASTWRGELPAWSGHSLRVFELSEPPVAGAQPAATPLATLVVPGRFVPANLENADLEDPSAIIGERAAVDGGGGSPTLFPGVTASVTASNLTPGEQLELWIAPNLDYFFFALYGGVLPFNAIRIGTGTVGADGKLLANFTLAEETAFGNYQLVAGVRSERYWPAGSWDGFQVTAAPDEKVAITAPGETAELVLGPTQVTASYPAAWAGETTAVLTSTGPVAQGFQLASYPPLYYHLSTDAPFEGLATVCIEYDPLNLPGQVPRLFHFDPASQRWEDVTTTRVDGKVCGETSSFSPFALGYPEPFDFSGFLSPISATQPNLAKPGQAIPVKFSLAGDHGLDVVTSARFVAHGTDSTPEGEPIPVTTVVGSGLTYDASSDTYTYVWKTTKALSLKTGEFQLTLSDDTVRTFDVNFKK